MDKGFQREARYLLEELDYAKKRQRATTAFNYAKDKFEQNKINFRICNRYTGHFNLLRGNKVVMSFWSSTGKCYIPSTGYSANIGADGCVMKYNELVSRKEDFK